jgi:hypothetical protein
MLKYKHKSLEIDMFVKVMNKPKLKQALQAWKNSRPAEKDAKLDGMIDLDLPVNEFTQVNLFIESTMLEREIIATMRNHIMWAQTSRVQNVLDFKIDYRSNPGLEQHSNQYEMLRSHMREKAQSGCRQDDYRLLLPVVSTTKYSISTNLRMLIKIGNYFRLLGRDIPHLELQFTRFGYMLHGAAFEILSAAGIKKPDEIFHKYKPAKILYDCLIPIPAGISSRIGTMITVSAKIPFTLRAQLVRHRGIQFQDEFLNFLRDKSVLSATMESPITVQIAGSDAEMTEVVRHRSCWIANYSIWADILKKIEDNLNPSVNPLPCHDGVCPFHGDAVLRIEGKDPNPPCPIHMQLIAEAASADEIHAMQQMVVSDKRSEVFWNRKIAEVAKA